ncbi:hypothetical protein Tco_0602992 [Tanacetum coccineum]
MLALESWAGQTGAHRASPWHAISDVQGENRNLQLQIKEVKFSVFDFVQIRTTTEHNGTSKVTGEGMFVTVVTSTLSSNITSNKMLLIIYLMLPVGIRIHDIADNDFCAVDISYYCLVSIKGLEDGMVYIDVPAYPPLAPPGTTHTLSPEWTFRRDTGGLIRDHAVRLEDLSSALFERYDRDIGELFKRSGRLGMRFSPRGQTVCPESSSVACLSDVKQGENRIAVTTVRKRDVPKLKLEGGCDDMRIWRTGAEECRMRVYGNMRFGLVVSVYISLNRVASVSDGYA